MRRWKWAGVGIGVLLVLAVGLVIGERVATRRAGERRLHALEADLDRTDPGWRWADIQAARDAARPPDDRNLTRLVQDVRTRQSAEFNQWSIDSAGWLPADHNRVPKPTAEAAARAAFATNAESVALARTVRTRPTGGWPVTLADNPISTNLEYIQRARFAAFTLHVDAVLAALAGDKARAAAAVADELHVAKAVGDDPFAVSQLVRAVVSQVACDTLSRTLGLGELPAADLAALEPLLLAEADFPRLLVGERGERAMAHEVGERVAAGRLTLEQVAIGEDAKRPSAWTRWRYGRSLPADRADLLSAFTATVAVCKQPTEQREPALTAMPRAGQGPLSRLLGPSSYLGVRADLRTIARLRSAAAAAACERHRMATGKWPDAIPVPVPTDPYTGRPLLFKRLPDGLAVYATGEDGTDDGGNLGEGRGEKGEDVGFRLWDVAARRQPPPPVSLADWATEVLVYEEDIRSAAGTPVGTLVATLFIEIARADFGGTQP